MRKLTLQMQISVDGYVSTGPGDPQHWVTWAWEEIKHHVMALLDKADTIIMGRKLGVDYIPYWHSVMTKPEDPFFELAQKIVGAKKIIFTSTLEKVEWPNTTLAKGDLVEEINRIKRLDGKDIIVYGGSSFVSSLVREELIDEFNLFVNPVALGKGDQIFGMLPDFRQLQLLKAEPYPSGIVLMKYAFRNPTPDRSTI